MMAWFFFKGRYGFGGSKGSWWVRFNDYLVHLKSPGYEPLFSERYGYYDWKWSWGGWRFIGKQSRSRNAEASGLPDDRTAVDEQKAVR